MDITVNGTSAEIDDGSAVADVVDRYAAQSKGVAVAVNSAVVPRREWPGTELRSGDRVEILTAVQGG